MNWFLYAVAGWMAAGGLLSVALIGKERKPVTPGSAVVSVVIAAALVVPLVILAGRLR